MKKHLGVFLLLLTAFILTSCGGTPRRPLTTFEKKADMFWLFSKFDEYYAPSEYKAKLHSFDYEKLKKSALKEAEKTTSNEEFYRVMHKFVAMFKDAHTSTQLSSAHLPGRASIAYTGLAGVRKEDNLKITKILPTFTKDSAYPLKVGDTISHINGKAIKDIILNDLVTYKDLGQDEANISAHMGRLFSRLSIHTPHPVDADITLTVTNGTTHEDVIVPWIVKDYYTFTNEQVAAATKKADAPELSFFAGDKYMAVAGAEKAYRLLDRIESVEESLLGDVKEFIRLFTKTDSYALWQAKLNSFFVNDVDPYWDIKDSKGEIKSSLGAIKRVRNLPSKVIEVPGTMFMPAYMRQVAELDASGKATGKDKLVGYILLPSFSLPANADVELKKTLNVFKQWKVKSVIVDMLDNGGGSLVAGLKLAQAFSAEKLDFPTIQFGLNEHWLDDFDSLRLTAPSDAEREIYRRLYDTILSERESGKRLSSAVGMDVFTAFPFKANADLEKYDFEFVFLINEMCASMCDIFAGIVQDNKIGTIMGTQSMGAGGNVVQHFAAPNSGLVISQTESLILRSNGKYIENNGIVPDVNVSTYDRTNKFQNVLDEALKFVSK